MSTRAGIDHQETVLDRVRKALGRPNGQAHAPTPPHIDSAVARLVSHDADLVEVFSKQATAMKMKLSRVNETDVAGQLVHFIREMGLKKIACANSPLMERLNVAAALRAEGIDATEWKDLSLDQIYDGFDCAVTDAAYAVAETGSIVIEPNVGNSRSLSLVPVVHVAIVEPKQILADSLDLMEKLADPDRSRSNVFLITGPSKTSDIEMTLVVGVHGPNVVKVFLLE
ncbi:MAG TPA: LUD domain-containing protein [Tepidisphaeraceae bacterium]|jgi:L-lactate dehydrogenase complex protein LldG